MNVVKRRVMKKHYRIVREALAVGKPVPAFPLFRVREYWDDFLSKRYLTVFHPWWYDNFDNWGDMDLTAEHNKHFNETLHLFQLQTGISLKQFGEELDKHKRPKRERKPRKEPPEEPIRKLRKPEYFSIYCRTNGVMGPVTVEGEKAFEVNGYSFFIHHNKYMWVVSDVETGAAIARSYRYKVAVKQAKERITSDFGNYLKHLEKVKAFKAQEGTEP